MNTKLSLYLFFVAILFSSSCKKHKKNNTNLQSTYQGTMSSFKKQTGVYFIDGTDTGWIGQNLCQVKIDNKSSVMYKLWSYWHKYTGEEAPFWTPSGIEGGDLERISEEVSSKVCQDFYSGKRDLYFYGYSRGVLTWELVVDKVAQRCKAALSGIRNINFIEGVNVSPQHQLAGHIKFDKIPSSSIKGKHYVHKGIPLKWLIDPRGAVDFWRNLSQCNVPYAEVLPESTIIKVDSFADKSGKISSEKNHIAMGFSTEVFEAMVYDKENPFITLKNLSEIEKEKDYKPTLKKSEQKYLTREEIIQENQSCPIKHSAASVTFSSSKSAPYKAEKFVSKLVKAINKAGKERIFSEENFKDFLWSDNVSDAAKGKLKKEDLGISLCDLDSKIMDSMKKPFYFYWLTPNGRTSFGGLVMYKGDVFVEGFYRNRHVGVSNELFDRKGYSAEELLTQQPWFEWDASAKNFIPRLGSPGAKLTLAIEELQNGNGEIKMHRGTSIKHGIAKKSLKKLNMYTFGDSLGGIFTTPSYESAKDWARPLVLTATFPTSKLIESFSLPNSSLGGVPSVYAGIEFSYIEIAFLYKPKDKFNLFYDNISDSCVVQESAEGSDKTFAKNCP